MHALLDDLNKQQRQAVAYDQGHLLLIAGAGTGKTRVLTYRIAYFLAQQKLKPHQIMALTFTNKAAREMKQRIQSLVGEAATKLSIGTFHAVCARFLRQFGEALTIQPDFVIYDMADQKRLMKSCMQQMNIDHQRIKPKTMLERIEKFKQQGLQPQQVHIDEFDYLGKQAQKLYSVYQQELLRNQALDFNDLLFYMDLLLKKSDVVRHYFHDRFKHLLVDEFQDTNHIQLELLQQLLGPQSTIFAVGDDDQSIYTWRGATPNNILNFEQYFPQAQTFKLEQNYRSTSPILDAANLLISSNQLRRPKKLFTNQSEGKVPSFFLTNDPTEEALVVIEDIQHSIYAGNAHSDHAILYRTNAQSRTFEEALRSSALPYDIVGGLRFFDRMEVKDAIIIIRFINNPDSDNDFLRISQKLLPGFGNKSLEKLAQLSKEQNSSLFQACQQPKDILLSKKIPKKAIKTLYNLVETVSYLQDRSKQLELGDYLHEVLENTGYFNFLIQNDPHGERVENIHELINLAHQRNDEQLSIQEFLTELSLSMDQDSYEQESGTISLMTLHAAKGLEFPVVYLVGLEEGLLPHARAISEEMTYGEQEQALEEERRLCYVGMTRAEKRLVLTAAQSRTSQSGRWRPSQLSRFVEDLRTPEMEFFKSTRSQASSIRATPYPKQGQTFDSEPDFDDDPWL